MKQTIDIYQFRRAFKQLRPDNFSYEGIQVLFDSLESLDDDTGTETELDVIAICCDFQESTASEVIQDYQPDTLDIDSTTDEIEEYLQENAFYCGKTEKDTFIFQSF